jgi:hypothetical protein
MTKACVVKENIVCILIHMKVLMRSPSWSLVVPVVLVAVLAAVTAGWLWWPEHLGGRPGVREDLRAGALVPAALLAVALLVLLAVLLLLSLPAQWREARGARKRRAEARRKEVEKWLELVNKKLSTMEAVVTVLKAKGDEVLLIEANEHLNKLKGHRDEAVRDLEAFEVT